MSQRDNSSLKAAVITGIFLLTATIITGYFTLASTLLGKNTFAPALPSATAIPAPTRIPTATPPQFDVFDDFTSDHLGDNWGKVEGQVSPLLSDGSLHLNYTASGQFGGGGVHINNNDQPLKLIETELVVNRARYKSYTYMSVLLGVIDSKPWYANLGIMDNGSLFYASAPVGESPQGVEKTWAGNELGKPNLLSIEWTGDVVYFSANSQRLLDVKAKNGGWWVIFGVGAEGSGASENSFNWAGWNYRR